MKKITLKEASDINTVADIPENWAFIQDIAQVDDIKEKYAQVKKTIECDSFYVEVAKDEYLNVYGMIGVVPDINKVVYPIVINGVEYMAENKQEGTKMKKTFAESYIVEESNFVKELKEAETLEPVERNMVNEKVVNKVDEYRLTLNPLGGYNWQDKRDGSDNVYKRHFPTKLELEQFITEYFGKRFFNTLKFPEEIEEATTEWDPDYWMKELVKEVGKDKAIQAINKSKSSEDTKKKQVEKVQKINEEIVSEASLEKSKYDALVGIIKSLSQDEIESAMEIIGGTLADVEGSDPLRASGAFERAYNEIMSAKRKLGK